VIDGQAAQLKLEGTLFFIASPEEVAQANWTFAGSLDGFEPGRGGLYVGDLDGSGQTSLAFHDARANAWYHGTFYARFITFAKVKGDVFQLGDGPTLFPNEENPKPKGGNEKIATSSPLTGTASASVTAAPTYPVMVEQFTRLGTSRHMDTTATVFQSGWIYCYTWVHNGVWLSGYHGRAQVVLLDEFKRPIIAFNSPRIGVTGTFFGAADQRVGWQANITGDALAAAREASIYQSWSPDFETVLADFGRWITMVLGIAQPLKSLIGK
jgi:hypothetical protein